MIDPIVVILAPPAAVFGYVLYDLRHVSRQAQKREGAAATVVVTHEPALGVRTDGARTAGAVGA